MTWHSATPTLFIFSGLPATGKSTVAQRLASRICAVYLRIDTVEQALRDVCGIRVAGEGYRVSYRIARDNLLIGADVIADSCNPIELTRREWRDVAAASAARAVDIEIVCSDQDEHRRRVATRSAEVPGLCLPSWREIVEREYHVWSAKPITIDTAGKSVDACVDELLLGVAGLASDLGA